MRAPSPPGGQLSACTQLGWTLASFAAVALGTERLVAFARAALPGWLDAERGNPAGEGDLRAERGRRLRVQGLAYGAALVLAAYVPAARGGLPLPAAALAASAGAALWSQCLRRISAGRTLADTRAAVEALRLRQLEGACGASPGTGGRAAPPLPETPDRRGRLLLQLYARAPDHLLTPTDAEP